MSWCWKTDVTEKEEKEHMSKTFSHTCPSRSSLVITCSMKPSQAELSAPLPQALKALLLQNVHYLVTYLFVSAQGPHT